jgi:protein O-GlcNAcase/histone acetyltransferase
MAESQKTFLSGVIEGFYGRPWTFEQRIDLFQKMASWGMQLYLYAPKDDEKHRNEWRDLYTLEEADELSHLIKSCEEKGVHFVYAIAPGLDIVFSKEADIEVMKKKLDQLVRLGCRSFSILFDDIDPDLCSEDAKVFPSYAHAQVSITNEIYSYLKKPEIFLFCPTEYCASRAIPSVKESDYLNHIGVELHKDIDILWTGPRVISKTITVASIEELTSVLRRKPVIWDNLHANDYDQRRLFLGPYSGRSTNLIPYLNGIFTNPNCEYHANFVAIRSLAYWSKCSPRKKNVPDVAEETAVEGVEDDEYMQSGSSSEGGSSPEHDQPEESERDYNPKRALDLCLSEWIDEFTKVAKRDKPPKFEVVKSGVATASMFSGMQTDIPPLVNIPPLPDTQVAVNGTSKEDSMTSVDGDDHQSVSETSSRMEVSETTDSKDKLSDVTEDLAENDPGVKGGGRHQLGSFSLKDLNLLVDFFYLPHKYGPCSVKMLNDFSWLNTSAPTQQALSEHKELFEQIKENVEDEGQWEKLQSVADPKLFIWYKEVVQFKKTCKEVCMMFARLTTIPNRPLLYDIYQYMWDAKEAIMLLDCYVSWLAAGGGEDRDDSWLPPDVEPFVLRGGITSAMQRLLPQLKGQEDFVHRKAPRPSPQIYTIRPYRIEDKEAVYKVCLKTGDSGADGTHLYPNYPNLLGDRFVGPYTTLSPELSFVLEDDDGVCGYVLAALDSQAFYSQFMKEWAPQVADKYSVPHVGIKELTPEEEVSYSLHNPKFFLPSSLYSRHPSHIHIDILPRAQGKGVGSRMIRTILSALKAKGSTGVHLEMSSGNTRALKFYLKFGFSVLCFDNESDVGEPPEGTLILGRSL